MSYEDTDPDAETVRPKRLRSLVTRGSRPVLVDEYDEETGEWRKRVKMSRTKFTEKAKGVFLNEYAKHGRMTEAAAASGVTPQTVRSHMETDEEFAEGVVIADEDYTDKLIAHHQNLLFNGIEKHKFDKNGNLIETSYDFPIRLIEMELKKRDDGYREKREVKMDHGGGVLFMKQESASIEQWEQLNSPDVIDAVVVEDDDK